MGAYFLYLGVILFWAVVFVRNRGFSLIIKEPIILFRGVGGRVQGSFIYEYLEFIYEYSYMRTWHSYMKVSLDEPGDCPGNKQPGIIKHQLRPRIKKPRMKLIKRGS